MEHKKARLKKYKNGSKLKNTQASISLPPAVLSELHSRAAAAGKSFSAYMQEAGLKYKQEA